MSADHPFTMKHRRQALNGRYGDRSINDWHSGDLPAPWAEGDVVHLSDDAHAARTDEQNHRLRGQQAGFFIVTYCPSIDDGDAWYARVWDGWTDHASDRMHVAYEGRCSAAWDDRWCNYMEGFTLVESADPDGLATRERMLATGWSLHRTTTPCIHCGGTGSETRYGAPSSSEGTTP